MSIKGKMFIILVALTVSGGLFISPAKAVKATNYAEEIAALQPGTTPEEITKSASQIAKQQRVKTDVILKQFYSEITADKAEGDQLAKESGMSVMGGSSGTKNFPQARKETSTTPTPTQPTTTMATSACTPPLTKLLNLFQATASDKLLIMPETWKTTPSYRQSMSLLHRKHPLPTGRYRKSATHTRLTSSITEIPAMTAQKTVRSSYGPHFCSKPALISTAIKG